MENKRKECCIPYTLLENYIFIDVNINISIGFGSPVNRLSKYLGLIYIKAAFKGYVTIFFTVNI